MTMPVNLEIVDGQVSDLHFKKVFDYLKGIDEKFSFFKDTSELSKINRGEIAPENWSYEMREVFLLSSELKEKTGGYFDIVNNEKKFNPSGIVKGWAIKKASDLLKADGINNFCLDVGGDIQVSGKNSEGGLWRVGIKNPFNTSEIVKVVGLSNEGIATSGNYERGHHIYNPFNRGEILSDILSLTIIGPDVFEADKYSTPAFAMGRKGIEFIESFPGLEAYMIDKDGVAIMTSGFKKFVI